MIPLLVFTLLAAADPCLPVVAPAPGVERDPAVAETYLEVGRAELDRDEGDDDAASFALREALRHDPSLAEAKTLLDALCRKRAREAQREQGLTLQEAGRYDAALEIWERLLAEEADPSVSLLAGSALLELGRDEEAARHLKDAQADARFRETASLLLGVAQVREGRGAQALSSLRTAAGSTDPRVRGAGTELLRFAHRSARLSVGAFVQGEGDSNVRLLPGVDARNLLGESADAAAAGGATLLYRPLGAQGPYARADGLFRKQARDVTFDFGTATLAGGYRLGSVSRFLAAEYGFGGGLLGGAPLYTAHHLGVEGRWMGHTVGVRGVWHGRLERFQTEDTERFSGLRQLVGAGVDVRVGPTLLNLGWRLDRAHAQIPELASLTHGPDAEVSWWPAGRARLTGRAGWFWRTWDAYDPDLMVFREDTGLELDVAAELPVSERWRLRAGGSARWTRSNVDGLGWDRFMAFVGVGFDAAVL